MLKQLLWLAVLALGVNRASAFVILGPYETYQVAALTYGIYPVGPLINFANTLPELGGPKNLGEEWRRNNPVLYYAYDSSFLDYFGSNGVAAVEEAISIINALTNVDYYSSDLTEWPLEAKAFNYKAQALNLTDVKSWMLSMLVEQMGLGEPERFVWTLHDREVGPGGCPGDVLYSVIKRNFDPTFTPLDVLQPSSYVNGTLYSYSVLEFCSGPYVADAAEWAVERSADTFTAVASYSIPFGAYYTGLTRDDVGGVRYLWRTNNLNVETAGTDTLTVATNLTATQLLFTSNLTELVTQSLTNTAAALLALYPNLVIANTTPFYTNLVSTNVFFYFTNYPWLPAGTFMLAFQTNLTTNVTTWFSHVFENVVTNAYYTNGFITVLETNIAPKAFGSPGVLYTNVKQTLVYTNFINGEYYILPTNSACGISMVATQLTSVFTYTNTPVTATNASPGTNAQQYSQSYIFYFTNHVYVINPVACVSNSVALRQGIEKIRLVRRDYDSLLERFYYPITNEYTLVAVTNSAPLRQNIRRFVNTPDFLISAEDLATESPSASGMGEFPVARSLPFRTNTTALNLFGPGSIDTGVRLTFNKVGPIFENYTTYLDEANQIPWLIWGSFDGSTNAPVVYPNGTSALNLESSVFIQVTPVYLPEAYMTAIPGRTNYYSAQLQVASFTPTFTPPCTWSLVPGTPSLPPGLSLSTVNATNAVVSGYATAVGTFDFVVRITDSQSRTTDRSFYIKVNP